MIDLKNLDKLSPEDRDQFNELLKNFPHIQSKAGNKLNTPTKLEMDPNDELNYGNINQQPVAPVAPTPQSEDELDFSSFQVPASEPVRMNKEDLATVQVSDGGVAAKNEAKAEAFESSLQQEEEKPVLNRVVAPKIIPQQTSHFSPEGKTHPVLRKMRAALGSKLGNLPVEVAVGGCTYGLQALDRSAVSQATSLALSVTSNQTLYDANLETALISFSLVSIDKIPLVDIFSIAESHEDGTIIFKSDREILAAQAMFVELLASPNELVETLGIYYQQHHPVLSLLEEGKGRYMCPEPRCMQFRISNMGSDNYCPVHGKKMLEEGELPNPS